MRVIYDEQINYFLMYIVGTQNQNRVWWRCVFRCLSGTLFSKTFVLQLQYTNCFYYRL